MKAFLLAAGFGSRLGDITKTKPKCLISVNDRPLLQKWLDHLIIDLGIKRVFVNTHYLHDQVDHFLQHYSYACNVTVLHEPVLQDTAGTLRKNISLFDEELLVVHADNYFTSSLKPFIETPWLHDDCSIKALTIQTDTPSKFGIYDVDKNNRVIRFREKPFESSSSIANAAIYRMRMSCVEEIARNETWRNISLDVLPRLSRSIEIFHYAGDIIDIGTPEDLIRVNNLKFSAAHNTEV